MESEPKRMIGWMLGVSVIVRDAKGDDDRAGTALIFIASPEAEPAGGDVMEMQEWAAGIVDRMAVKLRERGWVAPDALDGDQTFRLDDAYGDLDFSERKGDGWELRPGRFAIGNIQAASGNGEAALRKAYADLQECARELGLLAGPFAGEIRGFGRWMGRPGFSDRGLQHNGMPLYANDDALDELGARLSSGLQSEALGRAAPPASGASPGKKPGL